LYQCKTQQHKILIASQVAYHEDALLVPSTVPKCIECVRLRRTAIRFPQLKQNGYRSLLNGSRFLGGGGSRLPVAHIVCAPSSPPPCPVAPIHGRFSRLCGARALRFDSRHLLIKQRSPPIGELRCFGGGGSRPYAAAPSWRLAPGRGARLRAHPCALFLPLVGARTRSTPAV
jgi:hypothetical protein